MEYKYLSNIKSPDDVKKLNSDELSTLCEEIRDCLIKTVSKNGGHLASNLGCVELTVALHRVFTSPKDAIIFDVGHQSYTHKLLTGRFDRFDTLRKENGLSGYMRPDESKHDPFITGHSSNSISAAYGIYKAKCIKGEEGTAVAVIGDGAMTGGMVYEALNNAGGKRSHFTVILNDNRMSISKNVGSMAKYLNKIRSKSSYHSLKNTVEAVLKKIPVIGKPIRDKIFSSKTMIKNAIYHSNIFEGMGFNYFGPVDGHNISAIENILKISQNQSRPSLIHVVTVKGKGYQFAENEPNIYHGIGAFDIKKGADKSCEPTYSSVFGDTICEMAKTDDKVCAVTAAMKSGTGLSEFANLYKDRFFDVGIAEEHAATFSAGLASSGLKPYFAVYSSFLQRAFDQVIHDAAIAHLPLRLCIDRAGIVGEDGETHQGLFDVSFLSLIPGVKIYSPASFDELRGTLTATLNSNGITAVRYPRGNEKGNKIFKYTSNDTDWFFEGNKNLIITYSRLSAEAYKAAEILGNTTFLKLNKIYPLSKETIKKVSEYEFIYFFEEGIKSGGIGEKISSKLAENGYKGHIKIQAVENTFVPFGNTYSMLKKYKLDYNSMTDIIGGN